MGKIVSLPCSPGGLRVLIDENLVSKYVPWQAVYRFGPGFVPPAGAEVHGGATDAKSTQ